MAHDADTPVASARQFTLPVLVFGVVEVRRLRRELQALEEFIRGGEIREPGKQPALPRLSRLLDALATENHCNLLQKADREGLAYFLEAVETQAPSIHISLATDPSSAFMAKMVSWLRSNIHPAALLTIGLQPTIAAGCLVRTNNKQFDFSLRQAFTDHKELLLKSLTDDAAAYPATTATAQPAAPVSSEPQGAVQ
jgi:hypothetical protein